MKKLMVLAMTGSLLLTGNAVAVLAEETVSEETTDEAVSEEAPTEAEAKNADDASTEAESDETEENSAQGDAVSDDEISPYRACEHTNSYKLAEDSHEATDTEGGLRHYVCSECGAEYSYQIPLYMKQTRKQESRQTSLVPAIRCFHPGSMCRMENLTYSGQEMMKSGVYISMAPTIKREKACAVPSRFCGLHLSMI